MSTMGIGNLGMAQPYSTNTSYDNTAKGLNVTDKSNPNYECQTCKNRKYQDGSDEMVSFKAPGHISPESSAAKVRSHEQEHVTNAFKDAAKNNGKVVSCAVTLRSDICPECGRSYIAGGTTSTQIKYYNEDNPYQKDLKLTDSLKYAGKNADFAV